MKIRVLFVVCLILILLLSACVKIGSNDEVDVVASINALEDRIELLLLAQSNESKAQIENLRKEIEILRKQEETSIEDTQTTTEASSKFLYEINDGRAVITGYTGEESYIVIPSFIDGYAVDSIGEGAFRSSHITTVIISEGVKRVDWFAFYSCPYLTSVTLPSSVTYIGYSAFDGSSSSFTVYCHENSYAYEYAKSYGYAYIAV